MSGRPTCRTSAVAWLSVCDFALFPCPVLVAGGEFVPDDATLFLAHYNTCVDADFSKGARVPDPLDTVYFTRKGGHFGGGLVCRVGAEALRESDAERASVSLMPVRAFDGVRYAATDNLDLVQGTFECWVKPYFSVPRAKDMPADWPMQYFLLHYSESLSRHLMVLINSNSRTTNAFFFVVTTETGTATLARALDWQPGTWHHVAVTWDTTTAPGNLGLFLDGRKAGSASLAPLQGKFLKTPGGSFAVGSMMERRGGNPFQFYKADAVLDEIRISNTVRYQDDFAPPGQE